MKSPFDLKFQNKKLDAKIVAALERISEAFRVLLWEKSKILKLSPIQIQILIFLKNHEAKYCTINSLADEFNMTAATISDAVRVLRGKKLVNKSRNKKDKRIFYLNLTQKGLKIAEENSNFIQDLMNAIEGLDENEKESLLRGLIKIIFHLNQNNVVITKRMCFTCNYFQKQNGEFYCELLELKLSIKDLRIDCPEHTPISLHKIINLLKPILNSTVSK